MDKLQISAELIVVSNCTVISHQIRNNTSKLLIKLESPAKGGVESLSLGLHAATHLVVMISDLCTFVQLSLGSRLDISVC